MNTWIKAGSPLGIMLIIWLLPVPQGLTPAAWNFFAVFIGVITGLILEPLPASAIGLIGVTIAAALRLVPQANGAAATTTSSLQWALSGFTDATVWLIFTAFMFTMGYEKTGLGKRVALWFMKKLGNSALGLGYAASLADLVLAPFIPSNTARSGGTIYAVVKNIPPMYGSFPDAERRKIGAYLMWTCLTATCITSGMFLTGMAPNLLAISLLQKHAPNVAITWIDWFKALAPVSIPLFIIAPLLIYFVYPPTQKTFPETPKWAAGEMEKLGPLSYREILMALIALGALLMWIFGGHLLNATQVAMLALCLMVILNVVTWDDVVSNKSAWNTLAWFATLVAMAGGLSQVGFLKWLAGIASGYLAGHSMFVVIFGLLVFYCAVHYFFASYTAHVTALFPVMLTTAAAVPGMDMRYMALLLAGSMGVMGIITPFGTGASPVYANCGYIPSKDYWRLGAIFGLLFFAVYAAVSMVWMPMIL